MRLDQPIYPTAVAARAAGLSPGTVSTRLTRGELVAQDDLDSLRHPGTGRSRNFSAIRVLQMALGERLVRAGIDAKSAYRFALAFTDHNHNDAEAASIIANVNGAPDKPRIAGDVFPDDVTVFRALFSDGEATPVISIDRLSAIQSSPFIHLNKRHSSVLMIDLTDLRARTLAALKADR
jgi:hypothetical protein